VRWAFALGIGEILYVSATLINTLWNTNRKRIAAEDLRGPPRHSYVIPTSLPWPATALEPVRIRWRYAIGIPLIHLLSCLAFIPWLFSWAGVISVIVGLYIFGTLGINLCYHRLLTHQGFVAPKWLEHSLAVLGVCTLQDTPACWIAMHRFHHKHSDQRPDPHSPLVSFLWAHCGWLTVSNREFLNLNYYQRYSRDVLRDPFYMKLERHGNWLRTLPQLACTWA
jgi:stearoyl-CoA desaturase (delta-9 desaturase)